MAAEDQRSFIKFKQNEILNYYYQIQIKYIPKLKNVELHQINYEVKAQSSMGFISYSDADK